MSERDLTYENQQSRMRVAARYVGVAALTGSDEDIAMAGLGIAGLTAGQDPNSIDRNSSEYIFGVSDSLSSTLNAISESTPDARTVKFLQEEKNAELFTGIATDPNSVYLELLIDTDVEEMSTDDQLHAIFQLGLIEPGPGPDDSDHKVWVLSPWGKHTYFKLLPRLAEVVGTEQVLNGLRGILDQDR